MFQRKMRRARLVKNSRIDSQGDPSSKQRQRLRKRHFKKVNFPGGGGGGGGGYSTNFIRGGSEVQPLTLLYTIFHERNTPFVYFLLTNGTAPFHTTRLDLCIPFNCCKSIVSLSRNQ